MRLATFTICTQAITPHDLCHRELIEDVYVTVDGLQRRAIKGKSTKYGSFSAVGNKDVYDNCANKNFSSKARNAVHRQ